MKLKYLTATLLGFLAACGNNSNENSTLSSEKFSIAVFGIEMGSCTQDELRRFIGGETVPAISNKLSKEQQTELRQKFARVIQISANRTEEALNSEEGNEVRTLLKSIFPPSYSDEHVKTAFIESVADNQFTLLEFVSLYPTQVLKVNGLAFLGKKDKLEQALIKLEQKYNK